jgi:Tfp pilus assembly protein PilZ
MKEKRTHPRFGPLVLKVRFAAGDDRRHGYLTNVSAGGAFLAVESPPPLGAEIDFLALLPWRLGELRGSARVVWRSLGQEEEGQRLAGAGLAFTAMEEEAKDRLTTYLARFAELAARIEEMEEED